MSDDAIIGSVGVAVVPNADDFWKEFQAKVKPDADKGIAVRVVADTDEARADIEELRQQEGAKPINLKVKLDSGSASGGTSALLKGLLTLAPALIPVAGAAAAGTGALALLGVTGVLAVKGIEAEMKSGTAVGVEYTAGLAVLKSGLSELEDTAAKGVLTGFEKSVGTAQASLPGLNSEVAQTSQILGDLASHGLGALETGFQTFAPVINEVLDGADALAGKFETWAGGPGGAKFASTLYSDFKQVEPVLGELAKTAVQLVEAFAPSGTGALDEISLFSGLINEIPVSVLKVATTVFIAFKTAVAATAGIKAGAAALTEFATAETGAAAGAGALAGGRIASAAGGLASLATKAIPVVAAAAAVGFAVDSLIKTNNSWAVSNNAVESTIGNVGTELKTLFTGHVGDFLTGKNVSANFDFRDTVNQVKDAASWYIVLSQYANTSATETAIVNKNVAVLTTSQGAFSAELSSSGTSLSQAAQDFQTYNTSLGENVAAQQKWLTQGTSTGQVINGMTVYTKTWAAALQEANGDTAVAAQIIAGHADALQLDQNALTANSAAQQALTDDVAAASAKYKLTAAQVDLYASVLGVTGQMFNDGTVSQAAFVQAVGDVSKAVSNGSTAMDGWIAAVQTFDAGADTAAARGVLIGAALKAANGDTLDYASTMVTAASANQSLVDAMDKQVRKTIDLKTGTIDYKNAAAEPLISGLQQLQTAAQNAAAATYQHELATQGGTKAANDAYLVYKNDTAGALVDEASKLGLTHTQAKKLADTYFGLADAKGIKKQITLAGNDQVTPLLKGILTDLDKIVNSPHTLTVTPNLAPAQTAIEAFLAQPFTASVTVVAKPTVSGSAALNQILGTDLTPAAPVTSTQKPVSKKVSTHATDSLGARLLTTPASNAVVANVSGPGGFDGVTTPKATTTTTSASHATAVANAARTSSEALTTVRSDLAALAAAADGSGASLLTAATALIAAAKSAKITAAEYATLEAQRTALAGITSKETTLLARLGTAPTSPSAYDRLATAQGNLSSDRSTIAGTFGFDITQAGTFAGSSTTAGTGVSGVSATTAGTGTSVSLSSIQAGIASQLATAKKWTAGVKKLKAEKLNNTLWREIVLAGPSANGLATVTALLGATPKELGALNADEVQLTALGSSFSATAASTLDGAGVSAAEGLISGLKSQEKALAAEAKRYATILETEVKAGLKIKSPSKVFEDIGVFSGQGLVNGLTSQFGAIRQAAGAMVSHATPDSQEQHWAGLGADGGINLTVVGQTGQSPAEIGQIAAQRLLFELASR